MPLPPYFADRRDAGVHLARRLSELGHAKRGGEAPPLVLALPRGGVPVAFEVARALGAALDILLVRKIGAPGYPELALGAVVEGDATGSPPHTVANDDAWTRRAVDSGAFELERGRQLGEIARRQQRYRGGAPVAAMRERVVIMVDDGVATGATMRAALESARHAGAARVIAAVPVASVEGLASLRDAADECVSLWVPDDFGAVGAYYADFEQTTDEEVMALLREARNAERG
ncbi:phosphoribosyltransferase [Cupriavidus gilardii]|uniref:phosphoribosyltransferase n=1 Tax=Cupriavidus gilardii TaxID=82541 RepID=UPI0021BE74A7|nr:phosphoribosyltransferase family protein [Cupriavidus gilardii]MCT9126819.1 phosphoribosyltransferase family protein [Cupriavidus gilardii]